MTHATPHRAAECAWCNTWIPTAENPCVHCGFAGIPQAQDSLTNQLQRVYSAAVRAGEYDAADWIRNRFWGELDNPTNASLQPRRLK